MKTNIGLQLYSLRTNCDENLENVFKVLSNAGYDGVELYSFYNLTANKMKQMLNNYSLKPMGIHTNIDIIKNSLDDLIKYCMEIESKYVTLAYYNSDSEQGWLKLCETLEKAGERLLSNGLNLLYHNHEHEFKPFENGEMPVDIILKNTSSKHLNLELDCYWAKYVDIEPEIYLDQNLNRIKAVHLKDMDKNDKKMTEVGTGIINLAGIFKICQNAGFDWVIIEQDNIYIDPFDSVKISLDNVRRF